MSNDSMQKKPGTHDQTGTVQKQQPSQQGGRSEPGQQQQQSPGKPRQPGGEDPGIQENLPVGDPPRDRGSKPQVDVERE